MDTGSDRTLFLLNVALLILVHLHGSSSCRTGTRAECEEARFVPGYNLAGEGFDVVSMLRKGAYVIDVKAAAAPNHTCTLCENRFQGGQVQKLPAPVLDWRPFSSCSKQLSSMLHHSVDSFIRSSTAAIGDNWNTGLNVDAVGQGILKGSRSDIAHFASIQASMDKATFATHEISCSYYSYRLADRPPVSMEFFKHLQTLPQKFDDKSRLLYQRIIDTYGTHYIRQVRLGGRIRRVSAFRTCLATLMGFSESDIKNCLNVELKATLGLLPANVSFSQKCRDILKNNMSMGFYQGFMAHKIQVSGGEKYLPDVVPHQVPSEAYSSWISSLTDDPDIVSFTILPLHYLVHDPHVRDNLKQTVQEYIRENELQVDHSKVRRCLSSPNLDYNCCPLRAGRGRLSIVVQRASDLRADLFTRTDGFVKVMYGDKYEQTDFLKDENNPTWNVLLNFGSVELGHQLIFEVWDKDILFNDLLGVCRIYPERGTHLHSCRLNHGVFYYSYTVVCDAHLIGPRCGRYSPSHSVTEFL
ncbi:perforin 1.5 [Brienomyrus brachyistius]|uniref:perforin 1.5 n=1 Tax=Brienomyrus brachyistius TaxID=42636 RepID=UPI0020B37B8C|nr:perforin 1.5 [Brienomyrus brachyistius]